MLLSLKGNTIIHSDVIKTTHNVPGSCFISPYGNRWEAIEWRWLQITAGCSYTRYNYRRKVILSQTGASCDRTIQTPALWHLSARVTGESEMKPGGVLQQQVERISSWKSSFGSDLNAELSEERQQQKRAPLVPNFPWEENFPWSETYVLAELCFCIFCATLWSHSGSWRFYTREMHQSPAVFSKANAWSTCHPQWNLYKQILCLNTRGETFWILFPVWPSM